MTQLYLRRMWLGPPTSWNGGGGRAPLRTALVAKLEQEQEARRGPRATFVVADSRDAASVMVPGGPTERIGAWMIRHGARDPTARVAYRGRRGVLGARDDRVMAGGRGGRAAFRA